MGRDDFSQKTKTTLAERAGYKCSNPTCRVLTVKASPSSTVASTHIGMAAHITAASKNGPRYNPSLTPEERKSIGNGIWTCQRCGKVIDSAEGAFSVEMLNAWKVSAERYAARDFSANQDSIADLINSIDKAHTVLSTFILNWRTGEPYNNSPFDDDFDTRTSAIISYSTKRLVAYQSEIAPVVLDIIIRAKVFFGVEDALIQKSELILRIAPTNYFSLSDLDDYLQELKTHLSLY